MPRGKFDGKGSYTRSTYKLRPITGSSARPDKNLEDESDQWREFFFLFLRDHGNGRMEYIGLRFVDTEKGRKPRILLKMEKYRWSIAADFTHDWIAISPRHNTPFARYRSAPINHYEWGRSSVDTNNRALADRRTTTDCFHRHDCCHEPIKCYEIGLWWRSSEREMIDRFDFPNTVIFSKVSYLWRKFDDFLLENDCTGPISFGGLLLLWEIS